MTDKESKELRVFSLILFGIVLSIGCYPLLDGGEPYWLVVIIAFIVVLTWIIFPALMRRFYVRWVWAGEKIGNVISKIVLFFLYFFIFTTVSLLLKILGKDLLHKSIDTTKTSYWVKREQQPFTMKNQF